MWQYFQLYLFGSIDLIDLNLVTQKLECYSQIVFIIVGILKCWQFGGCEVLVTDDDSNVIWMAFLISATPPGFFAFMQKYRKNRSSACFEILYQTCETAKCMHLVDMSTIYKKAVMEEHDTDEGFYKQMPPVQHTVHKNVLEQLYI